MSKGSKFGTALLATLRGKRKCNTGDIIGHIYIAELLIRDFSLMGKKEREELVYWLRELCDDLIKNKLGNGRCDSLHFVYTRVPKLKKC